MQSFSYISYLLGKNLVYTDFNQTNSVPARFDDHKALLSRDMLQDKYFEDN